jgi:hypothetical protein
MKETIEISTYQFWSMYNALRDAEGTLWSCNGATNPEDQELTEDITETNEMISKVLDSLQLIVKKLKED